MSNDALRRAHDLATEYLDHVGTRPVGARVQAEGTCWLGGTTWQGREAMRISVSGWNTTESDVDQSVAAILEAASRRAR